MKKLLTALVVLAITSTAASAQNIVLNPGFENGMASWSNPGWAATSNNLHSGEQAAYTGCVGDGCINGANPASLFQDLLTVAGQSYNLSYWFLDAGNPYELQVRWNGTVVQDLTNDSNGNYRQFAVSNLQATGTTTRLEFRGRQDPGYNRLDDVSVVATGAVTATPEPASLVLLGTGLVGLFGVARRRKAASAA